MTTNPKPNMLEYAKQGNPKAISTLLNQRLKAKGIIVKASLREDCLRLLFEADWVPDKTQLIPWVENGLRALNLNSVSQVHLYGKSLSSDFPDWQHSIQFQSDKDKHTIYFPGEANVFTDPKHTSSSGENLNIIPNIEQKLSVKGTVLDFSVRRNQGIISGDNGKRFHFSRSDWYLSSPPQKGMRVDFEIENDRARAIYEDPSTSVTRKSNKSKSTAVILALFLGGFGVHHFYLGAWGWGFIYLIFFWTYIPGIVALVTGIRYLIMSEEEFDKRASRITKPFDHM